jgi:hypothetical protein
MRIGATTYFDIGGGTYFWSCQTRAVGLGLKK